MPNSPAAARIEGLHFINDNIGWTTLATGVHRTTNGGNTWTFQFYDSVSYFRTIGFLNANTGFIGTLRASSFLYKTTNSGLNWSLVTNVPEPKPRGLCGMSVINDSVIYCSGQYGSYPTVIKSTDAGNTWTSFSLSGLADGLVDCHFFSPDSGFVVGGIGNANYSHRYPVVLFTSNGGTTWITRYLSPNAQQNCWKISFPSNNTGYVSLERSGSPSRFLKTTNRGINWTENLLVPGSYFQQGTGFADDLTGWIGGSGTGTYVTTNSGENWIFDSYIKSVNKFQFLSDTLGYAAGDRIYKYSWGESIGIIQIGTEIPQAFKLRQNYPNPFNPTTKIKFDLPKAADIKFRVYDIMGKIVYELNEQKSPGIYEVTFDGSAYASGVYYYSVESEGFTETKKMVLIK